MAQTKITERRLKELRSRVAVAQQALEAYKTAYKRGDDVLPSIQRLIHTLHGIREESNVALVEMVDEARRVGLVWREIGDPMGWSRQGARIFHERNQHLIGSETR